MINFSPLKQDNGKGVLGIKPQKDIVELDTLKKTILPYSMFIIQQYAVLKTFHSVVKGLVPKRLVVQQICSKWYSKKCFYSLDAFS
jgi:hypothetical protein